MCCELSVMLLCVAVLGPGGSALKVNENKT